MDLEKNYYTAKEARDTADNSTTTLNEILTRVRELATQNIVCLDCYPIFNISSVAKKKIVESLEKLGYNVFKSHYSSQNYDDFNEITISW